jgi:hypothetical protein
MFDKVFSFLIDSDQKSYKKYGLAIIIIFGLLLTDYFFRFSDSYIAEKKIEQIGKIQEIIKQDSLNVETKNELLKLQTQVIKRQVFWESLLDLISFFHSTISSPNAIKTIPIHTNPIIKKDSISKNMPPIQVLGSTSSDGEKYKRSFAWHVLTSCWMVIFLMLVMPVLIFQKNHNHITISALIANEILLIIVIIGYSFLLALMPVYENPLLNYIINFFSMPFFWLLYVTLSGMRLSRKLFK